MDLIQALNVMKEAFKMDFKKASLHIRDYRNKSHFIEFVNNEICIEDEIVNAANSIGDGHRILAITFL